MGPDPAADGGERGGCSEIGHDSLWTVVRVPRRVVHSRKGASPASTGGGGAGVSIRAHSSPSSNQRRGQLDDVVAVVVDDVELLSELLVLLDSDVDDDVDGELALVLDDEPERLSLR